MSFPYPDGKCVYIRVAEKTSNTGSTALYTHEDEDYYQVRKLTHIELMSFNRPPKRIASPTTFG
jgi:hypothetical protein